MKRAILVILACGLFLLGCATTAHRPLPATAAQAALPVKHGKLQVIGTHLCDSSGKPVQLRGMSTMGLQWTGGIVNDAAFAALAKDWKADVVRLAMYVGEGGYAAHPQLKQLVWKGVDLAVKYGMYVIIDWHVLTPGNPNDRSTRGAGLLRRGVEANTRRVPNVLYEIMNEPNGKLSWAEDMKPYAEKMVATIRANDPDRRDPDRLGNLEPGRGRGRGRSGAGQEPDVHLPFLSWQSRRSPAQQGAGGHRSRRGCLLFRMGNHDHTGGGKLFLPEAETWLAFLDRHQISWTNWSLCDKSESSAALIGLADAMKQGRTALVERDTPMEPQTIGPEGYAIWPADELSVSGAFVREKIRAKRAAGGEPAKK
jgi:endoglucanase